MLTPGEDVVSGPYRTLRRLKDGDGVTVTRPELTKGEADSKAEEEKD